MALSPEEKQRLLVLLTLLSGGSSGRQTLSTIQPILSMIEQKQAESNARKEKRRGERNAIASQAGGLAGSLGGMYLIGQALAPAATTAAVATPTLIGATMTGAGAAGAGAGAAGAGAAGAGAAGATGAGVGAGAAGAGAAGAGAAGAAGAGTAGGAGSGAATAGAGAGLGTAAIVAGALIAAQNLYETGGKDILRGRGTTSDWLNMAMPNMLPRLLGRKSIGKAIVSGKSYDQEARDDFRGLLRQRGVADDNYHVTLADGSKFNIGLDGKTKYTNTDGKTTRNAWDVDFSNPLAKYAVDQIDPQIRGIYGEGKNNIHPEQYTGMIVNAVTSNAKSEAEVKANIEAIFGKSAKQQSGQPSSSVSQPAPTPTSEPTPTGRPSIGDILRQGAQAQQQQQQEAPAAKGLFMAKPQLNQPPPPQQPAPLPPPQQPAYRPPAPLPQDQQQASMLPSYRPPAPLPAGQGAFSQPPPQNQPQQSGAQGLLSLQDRLKQQGGGNMDVSGLLNLIKNLNQQNGARR